MSPSPHGPVIDMVLQIQPLYYSHGDHMHLAASDGDYELPSFLNINELVGKALKRIFKSRKPAVDPDLMDITFKALEDAVNIGTGGIKYGEPNFDLAEQLRKSAALFSASKSWQEANQLAALTVRPDGKIRDWEEFEVLSRPIVGDYNQRWLKTEYNTGIRAARSAIQWKKWEANADLYPNLRYLESKAANPRKEHKAFYGIVKPIDDDFWVRHMPPSAYGCLCGVEQTDDDVTTQVLDGPEPSPGLNNNPGLTGKLFSDDHPYIASLTPEELKHVTKKAKEYVTRRNEDGSRPG